MKWLVTACALVLTALPAWAQSPDNQRPGETASESAMPVIWGLINSGKALPHAVGTTHVCGDFYPKDGPSPRPKAGPLVGFHIDTVGKLSNIAIARSSGNAAIDQAALACVATWKYSPAGDPRHPIEVDWQNNIAWTAAGPIAEPVNTITVQSAVTSPPPISTPAAVGKPHVCTNSYPDEAVEAQAEGTTTIAFTITDQGTVADLRIATTSGNAALDKAALDCAKDWRYKPAIKNNVPVAVPWRAQMKWSLNGYVPKPHPVATGAPHDCSAFYPRQAELAQWEGTTELSFVVGINGAVKDLVVTKSSGHTSLDKAAVRCVGNWQYTPAKQNGQAIDLPWFAAVPWTPTKK
jgi:protein TonB